MVFLIPAIIILQYVLSKQLHIRKTVWVFIFAVYCMAVFSVVGIPTVYTLRVDLSLNVIPLADIVHNPPAYIINTVLNIILFLPMGLLLPAIWPEYRTMKKTVFWGFAVSVTIELLQLLTFRLTDIDDVITNTLGTLLGYSVYKMVSAKIPHSSSNAGNMKQEPVLIFISILLITFFLKPVVSNAVWDIVLSSSFWESIK